MYNICILCIEYKCIWLYRFVPNIFFLLFKWRKENKNFVRSQRENFLAPYKVQWEGPMLCPLLLKPVTITCYSLTYCWDDGFFSDPQCTHNTSLCVVRFGKLEFHTYTIYHNLGVVLTGLCVASSFQCVHIGCIILLSKHSFSIFYYSLEIHKKRILNKKNEK